MGKYTPTASDEKYGAITMPTQPSTGKIRTQTHDTARSGEGYNSKDDAKADGYGKLTGSDTNPGEKAYTSVPRGKVY